MRSNPQQAFTHHLSTPTFWLLASSFCLLTFALTTFTAFAQQAGSYISKTVSTEQAMKDAEAALSSISVQLHDDFTLSLWASDALVADPIALFIDNNGTAYFSRTNRQKNSEFDIRGHRDWMIRSIALQTVEDRRAFLHDELSPERSDNNKWLEDVNGDGSRDWRDLIVEKEEVYRIEDTSGDGMADTGLRIVEDFNEEITDVAGAIMTHNGDLFVGVGPDMWRMSDTDGDGVMDKKTSISHGYAVHIGFSGHGMSGLTMGPDGRVYWGIGDIGFHGTDQTGKLWDYSNQGVIVRSNPDGSDFEVFAAGLRNTHEFVFDEYGNLISVDNDGDHAGEHERLVYIVNGSDSGWRSNWQYGKYIDPDNNEYKVWMDEEMFKPRFEGQAAYITAPVALYHAGPTGMVYNPGTALNDAWKNYFFIAEFRGSPANSHIYAFKLKPKGASFELDHEKPITGGLLATGIEFGPDGMLYAADWINGWGTKNKGRIWKLDVKDDGTASIREEVKTLLAASFADYSNEKAVELLHHEDMRIRQKAQFELANRGDANIFQTVIEQKDTQLARIHSIWGLGQITRGGNASAVAGIVPLLSDEDPEIRAQAARQLGDLRYADAAADLIGLLKDEHARAQFFAAEALGRIGAHSAIDPIIAMLEANDDVDAYLRHAGSLALARIGDVEAVVSLSSHASRAVRIAAVVALRRMQDAGIAAFLKDADEFIVEEAARAINDDKSIEGALSGLAQTLEETRFSSEPLLRRAINANLRLGTREAARRIVQYANHSLAPEAMRAEALAALAVWSKPSVLDRVDGTYRGPLNRDPSIATEAFAAVVESVLSAEAPAVQIAATEASSRLKYKPATDKLHVLLKSDQTPEVRKAALAALNELEAAGMTEIVEIALADTSPEVRMAGLAFVPEMEISTKQKIDMLSSVFDAGSTAEQQYALAALSSMKDERSQKVLGQLFGQLIAGTLNPGIELDLSTAIATNGSDKLKIQLQEYKASKPSDDPVKKYSEALEGGDATRGRSIFYRHAAAQCVRCHNAGQGGGDVGPNLVNAGSTYSREELLVALVDPSATIKEGYSLATLTFKDGTTVTGTLIEEDDQFLVIRSGDSEPVKMAKADITSRTDAPSSMPAMGKILARRDLRDLVEFLSELK